MASVTMKIDGLDALQRRLAEVSERVAKNAQRAAVRAGAAVIREEAKQIAPLWHGDVSKGHPPPGTLKRSIILKHIPEQSSATQQVFYVTVRSGAKYRNQGRRGNLSQDAYYWKWVEKGHYTRAPQSAGATVRARRAAVEGGQVAGAHFVLPNPFMRPAFEAKKVDAVEAMKTKLGDYLSDVLKR